MNSGYVKNVLSSPQTDLAGTVISFSIQLGLTVVCVAVFAIFQPKFKHLLAPRLKFTDTFRRPKRFSGGLFGWAIAVLKVDERKMVRAIGVDSVVYICFMKLILRILAELSLVAIPLCIFYGNGRNLTGGTNTLTSAGVEHAKNKTVSLSLTSMSAIKVYTNSHWFLLQAFLTWIISFWIFYRTYQFWNFWIKLRLEYLSSEEYLRSAHSSTILLRNLPMDIKDNSDIRKILEGLGILQEPRAILLNRNLGCLPDLVDYHKSYNRKMEALLNRYLKNPNKIPEKRPMCRVNSEMKRILNTSGHKDETYEVRSKVDAINLYSKVLNVLEADIYAIRSQHDEEFPVNGSAFVAFKDPNEAHMALDNLNHVNFLKSGGDIHAPFVEHSPNFNDIYWNNLGIPFPIYLLRMAGTFAIFAGLMIGWGFLICSISTFLSLRMVTKLSPRFGSYVSDHRYALMVLQYMIAPCALALVQILPPYIFFYLSKAGGGISTTLVGQRTMNKFFLFAIYQIAMIFITPTVIADIQRKLLGDSAELPSEIAFNTSVGLSMVNNSSFFVTYIGTGLLGYGFEMIQSWSMILTISRKLFNSNTPRKAYKMRTIPEPFLGYLYAKALFMFLIVLVYCIISPLIVIGGLILFTVGYVIMKYQFIYVCQIKGDTGGTWWPKIFRLMMLSVLLFQFTTFIAIRVIGVSLQGAPGNIVDRAPDNRYAALFALSSVFATAAFYIYAVYKLKPMANFQTYDDSDTSSTALSQNSSNIYGRLTNTIRGLSLKRIEEGVAECSEENESSPESPVESEILLGVSSEQKRALQEYNDDPTVYPVPKPEHQMPRAQTCNVPRRGYGDEEYHEDCTNKHARQPREFGQSSLRYGASRTNSFGTLSSPMSFKFGTLTAGSSTPTLGRNYYGPSMVTLKSDVWEGLYDPSLIDPLRKVWVWKHSAYLLKNYHINRYLDITDYMNKQGSRTSSLFSDHESVMSGEPVLRRHIMNFVNYNDIQLLRSRANKLAFLIRSQYDDPALTESMSRTDSVNSYAALDNLEKGKKPDKKYELPPEIQSILDRMTKYEPKRNTLERQVRHPLL